MLASQNLTMYPRLTVEHRNYYLQTSYLDMSETAN